MIGAYGAARGLHRALWRSVNINWQCISAPAFRHLYGWWEKCGQAASRQRFVYMGVCLLVKNARENESSQRLAA